MVTYANPTKVGLDAVAALNDGYTINLKWFQAYPDNVNNSIAYHIYYSTTRETVYSDGIKYIAIDGYNANIINLTPGQEYFFSVRPVEYNASVFNLSSLPVVYDNLRIYPESVLASDITKTSTTVPLLDASDFLTSGVIKIGVELIQYSSKTLNTLNVSTRGYNNTLALDHDTSGFDGYRQWTPVVSTFTLGEALHYDRIYVCECRFEYPTFPFTIVDGYHQVIKDILTTDLTNSDASNIDFPQYDYAGYHRTDPTLLAEGVCLGSYHNVEYGCIDGYGNYNLVRGLSIQDQNTQKQEYLLNLTGRLAILIKRAHTGITCNCYLINAENIDDRCVYCLGSGFVVGYQQYFNPRRSDGKILIRVGPTEENLKIYEAGYESEFPLDAWTLVVPTIKTRDILVLFDQDGNEEFRYEVGGVTRNNTLLGLQGDQKLKLIRIRKTDPAYQIRVFRDTSMFPTTLSTSSTFVTNLGFHNHTIVVSEKITSLSQINQTTGVSSSHSHSIINGVVQEMLEHSHLITLP